MFKWLHHLLDPHCIQCAEERENSKVCQSCESLKLQLAVANDEKRQMLQSILSFAKPDNAAEQPEPQIDYEKLKPKMMTWSVRRQMLEAEDRKTAALLEEQRRKSKESVSADIDKLEKELGVEDVKA